MHDGICTTCLNSVEVEIRTITEVDECGSCSYSMRPFALGFTNSDLYSSWVDLEVSHFVQC